MKKTALIGLVMAIIALAISVTAILSEFYYSPSSSSETFTSFATEFTVTASNTRSKFVEITGANSSTVSPNATVCVEMAEGTIQLTVLNSATLRPVRNVQAEATTLTSNGFSTPCTLRLVAQTFTTGANGTVMFCCDTGDYNVTASYSGQTFLIQTVIEPERFTCVTLFVPSGKTIIGISQTFGYCSST